MGYSLAISPAGGPRTWTVLDGGYHTVLPVEDWLEAHRHLWSPNTVRGYATALAQWWTFLELRGEADRWREVGVPAVAGFLSWLRNGRTVEHAIAAVEQVPSVQTLEARLAALISFYRWQEAVFEVPVARRLLRGVPRRHPARGLLAHLDGRSASQPSSLVRVRRHRSQGRPPLLLPQQIQAILDACAVYDPATGRWVGNLRDRLLFATLAETGMRLGVTHLACRAAEAGIAVTAAGPLWVNLDRPPLLATLRESTVRDKTQALRRKGIGPAGWTPHWSRHSHATALLLAGSAEWVVARRLGHAHVQTTLDLYGWVREGEALRVAANWASYASGWQVADAR